jgi:hypothetical protein
MLAMHASKKRLIEKPENLRYNLSGHKCSGQRERHHCVSMKVVIFFEPLKSRICAPFSHCLHPESTLNK